MNQYPLWAYLLILAVSVAGSVYALPNVFGEDPALQITSSRGTELDQALEEKVKNTLAQAHIEPKALQRAEGHLLVRFADTDQQASAKDAVAEALGPGYVVALNLAPSTPGWLRSLGAQPMFLGLDLRGGVHFLLEVDMDAVRKQTEERFVSDLRARLREQKLRYRTIGLNKAGGILVRFKESEIRSKAERLIKDENPELEAKEEDDGEEYALVLTLSEQYLREVRRFALQQNITTLRNRVNELGVAEPVIQQQGENRVVVQLPGVQDTARAKEILGATATLEFRMVDEEHDVQRAVGGKAPLGAKLYHERNGNPVLLKQEVMLTGESVIDAASGIEQQSGSPAVFVTLDSKGARRFADLTRDQVGRPMAVVFIETKVETRQQGGEAVKVKRRVEEVINTATIREQLGKRFQIEGLSSTREARDLALLLRAGALAAPIDIAEERTVGPSLGRENIDQGYKSALVGFAAVLIFMGVYYKFFGLIADFALVMNAVFVIALLSLLQATLTLPGIAGIVLSVGMSVDANVLIFERIREELRSGNTPQASIHAGYEKAFGTIADSNITTLIAALVLFGLGTGPIKGFAITLSLGIVTSMFTAITGTRAIVNLIYGKRRVTKLPV